MNRYLHELEAQTRSERRRCRHGVLHIGGRLHGQHRTFPLDSPVWTIGWDHPITTHHPADKLHGEHTLSELQHYRPERLMFGDEVRIIFVVEGMTIAEAFDRILADLKR